MKLFENAGQKIRILAKVIFWLWIVAGLILGIILKEISGILILVGIIAGFITGWINAIMLYLIGELAENVYLIRQNTDYIKSKP